MAAITRICGSFNKISHRRSTSESNPIVQTAARASTSSCGSVSSQEWLAVEEKASKTSVKRIIVVVDNSAEARSALLWALSHVVHKMDMVTLLYVLHSSKQGSEKTKLKEGNQVLNSLKSLCLDRKPEIEVETLVFEGEKGPTIVDQAKKLDASVLVLGQKKLGFLWRLLRHKGDGLVDYCIQNAECLTLAVRRKSKKVGGYLINTKWQKNFWLLA